MTYLPDWLSRRAEIHPERLALLAAGERWSFAQLNQAATVVAGHLHNRGAGPGARVALLAGNSPAFAAVVHAMPRCGAALAPLNTRLTPAELAWQLADLGMPLLLHDAAQAELARATADLAPGVQLVQLERFLPALPTPNSQLPAPSSQLPTPNSQLPTPNSQLPTPNSPHRPRRYPYDRLHLGHHRPAERSHAQLRQPLVERQRFGP